MCTTQSRDGGGTYREGPGGSIPRPGTDHQCVPPRAVMVVGPTGKVLEVHSPTWDRPPVCNTQSRDGGGTYREGPGGSIPRPGTDHQCVKPRAVMVVGPTGKVLEVHSPTWDRPPVCNTQSRDGGTYINLVLLPAVNTTTKCTCLLG